MGFTRLLGMMILAGLLSGGLSGCQVVQAGLFVATVPHYHGGEGRETLSDPLPQRRPLRVPPTVTPEIEDE